MEVNIQIKNDHQKTGSTEAGVQSLHIHSDQTIDIPLFNQVRLSQ